MILGILASYVTFALVLAVNGLLCNGSTADFDSACLGSNPSNPT